MKIEIKCCDEVLVLTNESLNNDNFVDIYKVGVATEEMTVPIDELYSAVLAFKNLKNERKEM